MEYKIYEKSAHYYDAIHHFLDYPAQSAQLHELIQKLKPDTKDLLDVCCGTGKHLEILRNYYEVEGLDINSDLIALAKARCPTITFHQEDMRRFDLHRTFDAIVCLFSSIGSAKTLIELEQTIVCMEKHLRPGGIMIVEPWFSPDKFWTNKVTANFVDQPNLKISWMYKGEVTGRISTARIHYLIGTPKGIKYFTEIAEDGLFTDEEYLDAFRKAKLRIQYDPKGPNKRGMYIGLKEKTTIN